MDILSKIIEIIQQIEPQTYRAVIGFDAVIDYISRPIKLRGTHETQYFTYIKEFGDFISAKEGLSGVISIKRENTKIGGNMAILSNCLGSFGIGTDCIGTFGDPVLNPLFKTMSPNCTLYSVGEANIATALEFADGKIMLADMTAADNITWEKIKNKIGLDELTEMCEKAHVIGLVNWSELKNATQIWQGLYTDVVAKLNNQSDKYVCIDITDFTYRSVSEVMDLFEIIQCYSQNCKTILTFNENESRLMYRILLGDNIPDSTKEIGEGLYQKMRPYKLIIHLIKDSHGWDFDGYHYAKGFYSKCPKISTGAGDNFNGGLCLGLLAGMDLEQVLTTANAVSGFYVRYGYSPDKEQLIQFIKSQQGKDEKTNED